MTQIAWIVPLLPLMTFLAFFIFRKAKWHYMCSTAGIITTGLALLGSFLVLMGQMIGGNGGATIKWLTVGDTTFTIGYVINPLNALMLVIVSLVSLLVHIYSKGYMAREERLGTFYAYLGFFTFAMLALVLSPNLLQLYLFWELVGLGSFLLIGFYFHKTEAKAAAKKAFLMTRVGDVGLLIGMILLFWEIGSLEFSAIFQAVSGGDMDEGMVTLIALLIFVGAVGKSGQFPLHSWLPDAMEGPTPVSALIHAATMVAAGVYLVATLYPLFEASDTAMLVVAITGGFTAIFAACIAIVQTDIKRVLAYSTVSQLGYMMLALGSAGYVAGVFHLTTHAFFKALLFLAAGSVIHAAHTQLIGEMGGLWKRMKGTGWLFLIGTLAIAGMPLFSGFFSKEEVLLAAWNEGHYVLFTLALITAFLTAFYMFRLFFLVFMSKKIIPYKRRKKILESPRVMIMPMVVLAFLAVGAGYINTSWYGPFLGEWLASGNEYITFHHHEGAGWLMAVTTLMTFLGIWLAYGMYQKEKIDRNYLPEAFPGVYEAVFNGFFVDAVYQRTLVLATKGVGIVGVWVETYIIQGILDLIEDVTILVSKLASKLQNGQVQTYGTMVGVGLVVLLLIGLMQGRYF
ncbi:NADH-quinone oxidoreductase subunit L [Pontibacillus yanchengensis]|uniref:NADH-quinone oxidoreductase subunit L n=1 Tax=Pontibacillus yanchengensis TaxID=462910 RepID=A0ACC7VFL3_9BACI|nr:NADH-quinone oxidoreductase subunit L [Pontibacillus yanchengensis]MYL53706.1 NADH-quinone oxidoreductase subunit L [Pontibacillus yanchengensis]